MADRAGRHPERDVSEMCRRHGVRLNLFRRWKDETNSREPGRAHPLVLGPGDIFSMKPGQRDNDERS